MNILGIDCQSTTFSVWLGDTLGTKMLRTMYYSPDSLKYRTAYYDGYRVAGQGFISRYIGSIPLRLEVDGRFQSFIVVYEANSIERKILTAGDFYINPDLPRAPRDYSK